MNVAAIKLKAFALSSFIVAFAGALYAYYVSTVNQDTYSLNQVIGYYACVIVGGLGSLQGAVYGALLAGNSSVASISPLSSLLPIPVSHR